MARFCRSRYADSPCDGLPCSGGMARADSVRAAQLLVAPDAPAYVGPAAEPPILLLCDGVTLLAVRSRRVLVGRDKQRAASLRGAPCRRAGEPAIR